MELYHLSAMARRDEISPRSKLRQLAWKSKSLVIHPFELEGWYHITSRRLAAFAELQAAQVPRMTRVRLRARN